MFNSTDYEFMRRALQQARLAEQKNEVPVGAILVYKGEIIGSGYNCPIESNDPSAHAEIMALRQGALNVKNYRLLDSTLYVTLEPCLMCIGAIVHARVKKVIYGASDLKTSAVQQIFEIKKNNKLNHQVEYQQGLLAEEGSEILKSFFRKRRAVPVKEMQCN